MGKMIYVVVYQYQDDDAVLDMAFEDKDKAEKYVNKAYNNYSEVKEVELR